MASLPPTPPNNIAFWDPDFNKVRLIVDFFGTEDDRLIWDTLHNVYEDQACNPDRLPDSAIAQETARRLGIKSNTYYKKFGRMRDRTLKNARLYLLDR